MYTVPTRCKTAFASRAHVASFTQRKLASLALREKSSSWRELGIASRNDARTSRKKQASVEVVELRRDRANKPESVLSAHRDLEMLDESRPPSTSNASFLIYQRQKYHISSNAFKSWLGPSLFCRERQFSKDDFEAFFKDLPRVSVRTKIMEEILDVYIATHKGQPVGDLISLIIRQHLAQNNFIRAECWLDRHCENVRTTPSVSDPHLASPFTAYLHGISNIIPSSDYKAELQDISRVIVKMARVNIWPDIAFVNTLLQSELREDRASQALSLYEFLRRNNSTIRALAPNEEIFGCLFEVFRRLTRRQRLMWKRSQTLLVQEGSDVPALTPWNVFSDMVHGQRRILATRREGDGHQQPDVVSKRNCIAALRMFVEASDYTCALATLASLSEFRVILEDSHRTSRFFLHEAKRVILDALVNRCRSEVGHRRSNNIIPTWTDFLLGLRPGERRQLAYLPRRDTEERIRALSSRPVDYNRYPALREFLVSEETLPSEASPQPKGKKDQGESKAAQRSRKLLELSILLHHAVVAESEVSMANTERPEDVLLRSLLTTGQPTTKKRLFL